MEEVTPDPLAVGDIQKVLSNLLRENVSIRNLPIIFEEGEALDRHSIQELQTNSQVITALVNDNYETPTVVNLER